MFRNTASSAFPPSPIYVRVGKSSPRENSSDFAQFERIGSTKVHEDEDQSILLALADPSITIDDIMSRDESHSSPSISPTMRKVPYPPEAPYCAHPTRKTSSLTVVNLTGSQNNCEPFNSTQPNKTEKKFRHLQSCQFTQTSIKASNPCSIQMRSTSPRPFSVKEEKSKRRKMDGWMNIVLVIFMSILHILNRVHL